MSIVLVYMILVGQLRYTILEPMQDMDQCKRMKIVLDSSDKVLDVTCAALILDRKKDEPKKADQ